MLVDGAFTYHRDVDGTTHLVGKYARETMCGKQKSGWQRVAREQVDCDECADALRAQLIREGEVVLGYEKWREASISQEREKLRRAV